MGIDVFMSQLKAISFRAFWPKDIRINQLCPCDIALTQRVYWFCANRFCALCSEIKPQGDVHFSVFIFRSFSLGVGIDFNVRSRVKLKGEIQLTPPNREIHSTTNIRYNALYHLYTLYQPNQLRWRIYRMRNSPWSGKPSASLTRRTRALSPPRRWRWWFAPLVASPTTRNGPQARSLPAETNSYKYPNPKHKHRHTMEPSRADAKFVSTICFECGQRRACRMLWLLALLLLQPQDGVSCAPLRAGERP